MPTMLGICRALEHVLFMQEEVKALRTEVGVLKAQLTAQNVPNQLSIALPPPAQAGASSGRGGQW